MKSKIDKVSAIMVVLGFVIVILTLFIKIDDVENDVEILKNTTPTEILEYIEVEKPLDESIVGVFESIGEFKLTAYCCENYPHICNDGDGSITATGTKTTVGRTIAVDPDVIPYGTKVLINGEIYTAEDCGGAVKGNRIDILLSTHKEALNFGVQYANVSIYKEV